MYDPIDVLRDSKDLTDYCDDNLRYQGGLQELTKSK